MPIDYKQYPPNWKTEIRPAILERAGNRCEWCGVFNYDVGSHKDGIWLSHVGIIHNDYKTASVAAMIVNDGKNGHEPKAIVVVLTIAHIDHDTNNNDHSNLAALCQRCHNRHDTKHRKANRAATRAKKTGQMKLGL